MSQPREAVVDSHPVGVPLQFRPILRSHFFFGTLILAFIGWGLALIAQVVVTANLGNTFVGVLWFAIVLQTCIIVGVVLVLASNTVAMHRIQIAMVASMTAVFAAIGVDRNVFSNTTSQQAMAAGWLITAVVDTLWVLYFTSESSSPVLRFLISIGGLDPSQTQPPPPSSIPNVATNVDAFAAYQRGSARGPGNGSMGTKPWDSAGLSGNGRISSGPSSPRSPTEGARMATARAYSSTSGNRTTQPDADPQRADARPLSSTTANDVSSHSEAYPYRAEALYEYNSTGADPKELSFVKGEMLDIIDKSGKWWEARKSNGTKGIVPSNYLRIL